MPSGSVAKMILASGVLIACTLTSALCAALLIRAYRKTRQRLLFWSALCFIGLCLNNALLFVDIIALPSIDLSVWRLLPALLGIGALCYGLIMEVD